ncbi:MAG TPA: hypothetical protein H9962_09740 [Candidatus Mailhella merdigallinarum]|uniref:Uncharacterized protein n=1 Tax=Candidatus Mailhella merdigallinarum TaxID=2838658 RepID=A0A9D2HE56_9BACT|nr:hypothetical protein [Candidatus Mailhella merdigallinarum]
MMAALLKRMTSSASRRLRRRAEGAKIRRVATRPNRDRLPIFAAAAFINSLNGKVAVLL